MHTWNSLALSFSCSLSLLLSLFLILDRDGSPSLSLAYTFFFFYRSYFGQCSLHNILSTANILNVLLYILLVEIYETRWIYSRIWCSIVDASACDHGAVFGYANSSLLFFLSLFRSLSFVSVSLSYKSREKSLANRLNVFWARKQWKRVFFPCQTRRLATENLWQNFSHDAQPLPTSRRSKRDWNSRKFIWFVLCIKSNYLIKN